MKQINQQFKKILESKCLTKVEKIYMRNIFIDFVNRRKIIARNSIQLIDDNEFGQEYQLDSIIG